MARTFRQRSALTQWEMHYGPNMTPMVDVVMVILIFFMASTSFIGTEWFLRAALPREAETPRGETSGDAFRLPPARFEVILSQQDGVTVFSGRGIEAGVLGELHTRLVELKGSATSEDIVLLIRSQPDVPYADVIGAHEAAAAAGIEKIGLLDAR